MARSLSRDIVVAITFGTRPLLKMTVPRRLVVFSGNLAYSVRKGIVEIDDSISDLAWLIVVCRPRKTLGQLVRSQWINLKRNGLRWIPYQTLDAMRRVFPALPSKVETSAPGAMYSADALTTRKNVRVLLVNDLHSELSLAAVREFLPELGLALAAPILREPLFAIPRFGTINLHKGQVPNYRGMPPAFWELWNNERAVGCTVHKVDAKLDTGQVVCHTEVPRAPYSTLRGLQLQLDEAGVLLMRDAVRSLLDNTANPFPQSGEGKTYRKPTLKQFASLEKRMAIARAPSGPVIVRAAKALRSYMVRTAWSLGWRHALKPRITVLLYHRVTDEVRDNLTVGIEQFDRQMALLRKHCKILSIDEVVNAKTIERSDRPLVAVTFDDGYMDNFNHAAMSLLRHNVPAAFFVTTGLLGTDRRFPHDQRRGNPPIPLMTWDQVRLMQRLGFTIGSHSVSHIDCAAEPEDVVRSELAESRDTLRVELGLVNPIFAYPYGKRENMTPERLDLVREAGYRACLSAYGGTNVGTVDQFNVLRRGIHWEFDDGAFLYECLGR